MYRTHYSCQIVIKVKFSKQILEKLMKTRPVGAELFREDRGGQRTDKHD